MKSAISFVAGACSAVGIVATLFIGMWIGDELGKEHRKRKPYSSYRTPCRAGFDTESEEDVTEDKIVLGFR